MTTPPPGNWPITVAGLVAQGDVFVAPAGTPWNGDGWIRVGAAPPSVTPPQETPLTTVEFIRARIAEDRAIAERAASMSPALQPDKYPPLADWEYAERDSSWRIRTVGTVGTPGYEDHHDITRDSEGLSDSVDEDAGPHIARHDPARVLRQCDALEAAVEAASPAAIRAVASIWSDHPDYRPASSS